MKDMVERIQISLVKCTLHLLHVCFVEGATSTCAHGPDEENFDTHVPFRSKSFGILGPAKRNYADPSAKKHSTIA